MKNKKNISIRLKKVSISNLSSVNGGIGSEYSFFCSAYCSGPKMCPTTVDPRAGSIFENTENC